MGQRLKALYRSPVQFPALTWMLTTVCSCSPMEANTLYWFPCAQSTQVVHRHTQTKHTWEIQRSLFSHTYIAKCITTPRDTVFGFFFIQKFRLLIETNEKVLNFNFVKTSRVTSV